MQKIEWLKYTKSRWPSFFLFLAVALSAVMASLSAFNAHPDEKQHVEAGKFYETYWLPPKVGDPRVEKSYSVYGLSYLNNREIAYILGGKFSALLSPILEDSYLRLRLFNVALFLGLAAVFLFNTSVRPLLAVLLITPQIWYVFSYFNGDAFPLFLSLLIAHQLVSDSSIFNRYVNSPGLWVEMGGGIWLGVLLGLLLISKLNFLFFFLFAVSYVIGTILGFRTAILILLGGTAFFLNVKGWPPFTKTKYLFLVGLFFAGMLWWVSKEIDLKKLISVQVVKYVLVFAVALSVFSPWVIYDRIQNGSKREKSSKIAEVREKFAKPEYKPSAPGSEQMIGLRLKNKGIRFSQLFSPPLDWHKGISKGAAGVYGWFNLYGPPVYYGLYFMVFFGFLGLISGYSLLSQGKAAMTYLSLSFLFVLILLYVQFFFAWTIDYQAQGRHLFPALGVLAMLIGRQRLRIFDAPFSVFVFLLFLLSVYSFVFVGLGTIPKIDF